MVPPVNTHLALWRVCIDEACCTLNRLAAPLRDASRICRLMCMRRRALDRAESALFVALHWHPLYVTDLPGSSCAYCEECYRRRFHRSVTSKTDDLSKFL